MKQTELIKILAKDLKAKTADLAEVNTLLKAKNSPKIKYRLSGKELGHYGFTGLIKALTENGLKVFEVNKVTLIPYSSIEKMEVAKPREKRVARPAAEAVVEKPVKKSKTMSKPKTADDDDDLVEKKKPRPGSQGGGSKYIPGR